MLSKYFSDIRIGHTQIIEPRLSRNCSISPLESPKALEQFLVLWTARERSQSLNADLVTLSACETALGKLEGREGVRGLKEAFLTAGAHSVVASHWNVEDQSTTGLMINFYAHIANGEDKAAALTHAKLDFLRGVSAGISILLGWIRDCWRGIVTSLWTE